MQSALGTAHRPRTRGRGITQSELDTAHRPRTRGREITQSELDTAHRPRTRGRGITQSELDTAHRPRTRGREITQSELDTAHRPRTRGRGITQSELDTAHRARDSSWEKDSPQTVHPRLLREATMIGVIELVLLCGGVSAGSHSLRYFYTAMTPIPGLPEFVAVGYVDDATIDYYDSNLQEVISRQQWMAESQGPEYWEQQTQILRSSEHIGQTNIQTALNRTNQTGGIHTVQVMYGCELQDDGSTSGFHQEGWDGRDYISFDKDNMVWVTPVSWGLITKNKWDQDKARNQQRKGYLEGTCIEWLKKYLKLGEKELRHVAPQVFLSADKASAAKPTQLCCLVTGFYPRDIEVTLLRNGAPIADTCSTGILPNHDGTYQLRRWVQIAPENGANYSCQYEQSEKEGMEILDWVETV
ncbi:class I histocompatibility antigen, F10 alpha chain-like isoform X6 [Heterodontus francisci]|uniref:class I histocompatibility antigen, F10 alpha chain-like isoform X6 n=1 Tax=Heterodontus francisci TaxID=7792 RepID=UPI00355C117C